MEFSFKKKLQARIVEMKAQTMGFSGGCEASCHEGKITGLESALEIFEECEGEIQEMIDSAVDNVFLDTKDM